MNVHATQIIKTIYGKMFKYAVAKMLRNVLGGITGALAYRTLKRGDRPQRNLSENVVEIWRKIMLFPIENP